MTLCSWLGDVAHARYYDRSGLRPIVAANVEVEGSGGFCFMEGRRLEDVLVTITFRFNLFQILPWFHAS